MIRVLPLMLLLGCNRPLPGPEPAPSLELSESATCGTACARMAEMGCQGHRGSEGEDREWGTPDDISCVRACEMFAETLGHPLPVACLTEATECGECDG